LKYTDPQGLDVTLEGTDQQLYIDDLNGRRNAKFKVANVNGKVTIEDSKGKALNDKALAKLGGSLKGGEQGLFLAITDKNTHATIDTGNGQAQSNITFGLAVAPGKNAIDYTDVAALNKAGNRDLNVSAHETVEAYATASGLKPFGANSAHDFAGGYFPGFFPVIGGVSYGAPDQGGNVTSYTADIVQQNNANNVMRVRGEFVTPQPIASLPPVATSGIFNLPPSHIKEVTPKK
jgi:hypothetical protein